jgi:hypothetical protein
MKKSYFLFPFVAILLWAGNVIVSKLSARTIDPSAITFYRLLLAVALMSLFTLKPAWGNRAAIVPQLPKLAVLGLAYKEDTHSTKNSPSFALIEQLGPYELAVYDPVVPASAAPHPKAAGAVSELAACQDADTARHAGIRPTARPSAGRWRGRCSTG